MKDKDLTDFLNDPLQSVQPLSKAPKDSVKTDIFIEVREVINDDAPTTKKLIDDFGSMGDFKVIHNGSFHEWNLAFITKIEGKVYNILKGADFKESDWYMSPPDSLDSYSAYTITYIPDSMYEFFFSSPSLKKLFLKGNIFFEAGLYRSYAYRYWNKEEALPLKASMEQMGAKNTIDYVNIIYKKATNAWKMSREAMNEDTNRDAFANFEEVEEDTFEEDHQRATSILLLMGKTRYNGGEIRPKNWDGTAWV